MLQVRVEQGATLGAVGPMEHAVLSGTPIPGDPLDDVGAFAEQLLAALVVMAGRSKRRQADLNAVLRRAKLQREPEQVSAAITLLEEAGLIHEIVPLYDGGMLVSITSQGMDRPRSGDRWAFLERRRSLNG